MPCFFTTLARIQFGNPGLLPWLAAVVVPWLIMWFGWRMRHETPWAAMELLRSAMQQRARRIRFQQ